MGLDLGLLKEFAHGIADHEPRAAILKRAVPALGLRAGDLVVFDAGQVSADGTTWLVARDEKQSSLSITRTAPIKNVKGRVLFTIRR